MTRLEALGLGFAFGCVDDGPGFFMPAKIGSLLPGWVDDGMRLGPAPEFLDALDWPCLKNVAATLVLFFFSLSMPDLSTSSRLFGRLGPCEADGSPRAAKSQS